MNAVVQQHEVCARRVIPRHSGPVHHDVAALRHNVIGRVAIARVQGHGRRRATGVEHHHQVTRIQGELGPGCTQRER